MAREFSIKYIKRLIFTLLGLLLLLVGLAAGIFLIQQQQEIREKAAPAEPR